MGISGFYGQLSQEKSFFFAVQLCNNFYFGFSHCYDFIRIYWCFFLNFPLKNQSNTFATSTKNERFFFTFFISHSPSLPVLSTSAGGNMMPTTPSSSSSSASSTHLQVIGSSVVSSQQQSGPQASPQAPTYVNL